MPELPEVECIRRSIEPHLLGRTLHAVTLHRPSVCTRSPARTPYSRALLKGAVIARTLRHGKQLALIAHDERTLCIHLGMSGQLLLNPPAGLSHVHALWTMCEPATTLVFRDPRRFGGLWTFESPEQLLTRRWARLGPDALSIQPDELATALTSTTRPVKAALLDQTLLAGVGNIYADEALFHARIHPLTPGNALDILHATALALAIRETLASAIEARGSTLRDYRNADGSRGQAATLHRVYARAGLPCTRCSRALSGTRIAQRATVWCPSCQPTTRR